jgi:hypothetical protein
MFYSPVKLIHFCEQFCKFLFKYFSEISRSLPAKKNSTVRDFNHKKRFLTDKIVFKPIRHKSNGLNIELSFEKKLHSFFYNVFLSTVCECGNTFQFQSINASLCSRGCDGNTSESCGSYSYAYFNAYTTGKM